MSESEKCAKCPLHCEVNDDRDIATFEKNKKVHWRPATPIKCSKAPTPDWKKMSDQVNREMRSTTLGAKANGSDNEFEIQKAID